MIPPRYQIRIATDNAIFVVDTHTSPPGEPRTYLVKHQCANLLDAIQHTITVNKGDDRIAIYAQAENLLNAITPKTLVWDGDPLCELCGVETDAGHCIVCSPRDDIERTESIRATLVANL